MRDELVGEHDPADRRAAGRRSAGPTGEVDPTADGSTVSRDQAGILALQRQAGNRAVAGRMAGPPPRRPLPVQRDDPMQDVFDAMLRQQAPSRPDMTEEDWRTAWPVEPPLPISEIQLVAPARAPAAPPKPEQPRDPFYVPPERCQPSHHQSPGPRFDFDDYDSLFVDMERRDAWNAFQGTLGQLTMNWNSSVPLVNAFHEAQSDPSLQSDEMGLKALGPGFAGDVGEMVEQQRVPPASGSGRTVGGLFSSTDDGTALARPPGDSDVDRLAADPRIRDARATAVAADGDIHRQVLIVKAKAQGITGAAARLNAAQARAQLLQARDTETSAQADVKRLEEAKKATAENAKKITGLLTKLITAESPEKAAGAVVETVVGETLDLIAGEIVDAKYADQIAAASQRLAAASSRVKELATAEVKADIEAAQADLARSRTEFDAERAGLSPLLVRRRSAYERLGRAIGSSGRAPSSVRRQVQAVITAIPLVETVVSRANNVVSTLGELTYSAQSGIGLSMARYARLPIGDQFLSSVASYQGVKNSFVGRQRHWQARLESLRAVMRRLSGLQGR